MARETILGGKAWQSVSWLVLGEAAPEAAASVVAAVLPIEVTRRSELSAVSSGTTSEDVVSGSRIAGSFPPVSSRLRISIT